MSATPGEGISSYSSGDISHMLRMAEQEVRSWALALMTSLSSHPILFWTLGYMRKTILSQFKLLWLDICYIKSYKTLGNCCLGGPYTQYIYIYIFFFKLQMGPRKSGFIYLFRPCHVACGISVPQPGIEPVPSAVKTQNPNHRTDRGFLTVACLDF